MAQSYKIIETFIQSFKGANVPGTFHKTEYSLLFDLTLAQRGVAFEWLKTKSLEEILQFKYEDDKEILVNERPLTEDERNVFLGFIVATKITYFEFDKLELEQLKFLAAQLKDSLILAYGQEFSLILKRIENSNYKVYTELKRLLDKVN